MSVLMLGMSTSVMAQEAELKAAIDAVKSKAANAAELVKVAQKKNKKDPNALLALGRAFYEVKDTAGAARCANMANEAVKPKYSFAPAYLLLGDIEASYGTEGGKAAGFYNQAIHFDPKNPEGYKKWAMVYRKISPRQSAEKLQELKKNCPEVEVDAITGHIFMLSGDEKAAYEAYKKADVTKLDRGELNEYARCSYFTGHFDDALKASEAGMKLFPRNPTFVRLAMFSNYELKNLDAAKGYINRYFNETDSAKFSEYDHYYAALIYQDLQDKANAYAEYDKALALVNDSSMIKRWAILKSVSDSYLKEQNFDNAIRYYQDYLGCKPDINSDDHEGLAKIYSKYADADETKKAEMIAKAVAAYREMGEKFPIQNVYAAYQCASMNNKLDKNGEKGLAKPDFQRVVDLLASKADRDKSENTMLKYSYHYLMTNAFLYGKNKALAKEYADKILAIDPEYAPALQVRDVK